MNETAMNEILNEILKRLENYSDLSQRERKSLQKNLIDFSSLHTDKFIEIVRGIEPKDIFLTVWTARVLGLLTKKRKKGKGGF